MPLPPHRPTFQTRRRSGNTVLTAGVFKARHHRIPVSSPATSVRASQFLNSRFHQRRSGAIQMTSDTFVQASRCQNFDIRPPAAHLYTREDGRRALPPLQ